MYEPLSPGIPGGAGGAPRRGLAHFSPVDGRPAYCYRGVRLFAENQGRWSYAVKNFGPLK
jgi:hypothetical protein